MVLFVYAVISPVVDVVSAVCFAFMGSMFRGQFMYTYGRDHDSGGKLWAHFIQIMLTCMLIAELTSKYEQLQSCNNDIKSLSSLLFLQSLGYLVSKWQQNRFPFTFLYR